MSDQTKKQEASGNLNQGAAQLVSPQRMTQPSNRVDMNPIAADHSRTARPYQNYVQTIREAYAGAATPTLLHSDSYSHGSHLHHNHPHNHHHHHHHHNQQQSVQQQYYQQHEGAGKYYTSYNSRGEESLVQRAPLYVDDKASNDQLLLEIQQKQNEIAQLKQQVVAEHSVQENQTAELKTQLTTAIQELQRVAQQEVNLNNELNATRIQRDKYQLELQAAIEQGKQHKISLDQVQVQVKAQLDEAKKRYDTQRAEADTRIRNLETQNLVLQKDCEEAHRRLQELQDFNGRIEVALKSAEQNARTYQSNANEKDREKIELLRIKDQEANNERIQLLQHYQLEKEGLIKHIAVLEEQLRVNSREHVRFGEQGFSLQKQLAEEREIIKQLRIESAQSKEAITRLKDIQREELANQARQHEAAVRELQAHYQNTLQEAQKGQAELGKQMSNKEQALKAAEIQQENTLQNVRDYQSRLQDAQKIIENLNSLIEREQERRVELVQLHARELETQKFVLEQSVQDKEDLRRRIAAYENEITDLQTRLQRQGDRTEEVIKELANNQLLSARERQAANAKIHELSEANRQSVDQMYSITKEMVGKREGCCHQRVLVQSVPGHNCCAAPLTTASTNCYCR